jgi:hypothetical protein
MADVFAIADLPKALATRAFPTITTWNRVEGRPRTVDFQRALRAEVRDALWMLTRQWQAGELQGEDAGSPASMRASLATTRLTRFRPGDAPPRDFDDTVPFETQVERRPVRYSIGPDKVALDLRLVLGRRWLRQIAGIGDYAAAFIGKYGIAQPDATRREDAAVCAHADVLQSFAAAAGRALDGASLFQYLTGPGTRHAYDGIAAVLPAHYGALDTAAAKFVAWARGVFDQPDPATDNPAWNPQRLEYRFACSAPHPVNVGEEKTYVADEYFQGTLDWYDLDVVPGNGAPLGASDDTAAPDPRGMLTRSMLPAPLTFPGMPHPRWWTIEDSKTNFGAIKPDTTDLAKLLLIEFGLVYSNDWFIIPFTLPAGGIAEMQALVVTDVFGDRYWIDAAGAGADADWQRWSFLTVSAANRAPVPRASDPARRKRPEATRADNALLFLPTVPKVQEGPPHEDVRIMRDEMANMVWAIEKAIPAPDGRGRSGDVSARDTRAYHERLVAQLGAGTPAAPLLANTAKVRYDIMSTVPENWIPFVAVRAFGSNREINLQRASMLRNIEGDDQPPARVKPRTSLLRAGLDQSAPAPYLVPEEEVPRAGVVVTQSWQRTRGPDGRAHAWIGVRKRVGRGEGASGLAFDRLVDLPPRES